MVTKTLEEKQEAAVLKAREKRAINRAVAADASSEIKSPNPIASEYFRRQKLYMPASNRVIHNGFPPADDMIIIMGIIAVVGNAANGKTDVTGYVKIITATIMLAIVLGLMDRGAFASPVRAFAFLGVLAASLYYIPAIFKGMNGGSNTVPTTKGPTKTIGTGTHKVTTPANKFSQGL